MEINSVSSFGDQVQHVVTDADGDKNTELSLRVDKAGMGTFVISNVGQDSSGRKFATEVEHFAGKLDGVDQKLLKPGALGVNLGQVTILTNGPNTQIKTDDGQIWNVADRKLSGPNGNPGPLKLPRTR